MSEDKLNAYQTLHYVLVNMTRLFAPVAPFVAEKIYHSITDGVSVHLEDWPAIPEKYRDDELLEQVDLVQSVISLARSIRNKNGVKNRQPLKTLNVAFSDADKIGLVKEFENVIMEEMNVKNITILSTVEEIATVKTDPNFNVIKALYPDKVKDLIKAIKSGQFKWVEGGVLVKLDSGEEVFDSSVILVSYIAKEGFHVASDRGIIVSLDLEITDELKKEGLARDIVRNIQDARKNMGCDILDTIKVELSSGAPEEWLDYICKETLAVLTTVNEPMASFTIDDDDAAIEVKISK